MKYIITYLLLNDLTIIENYRFSKEVRQELVKNSIQDHFNNLPIYFYNNEFVLIGDDDGFVLKSLDDYKKILNVGIKAHTSYFTYCPNAKDFYNYRYEYIEKLAMEFKLDKNQLDFSMASVTYLRDFILQNYRYKRFEIERNFLGILAYCGESYIYNADRSWFFHDDPSWYPLIKMESELYKDLFKSFYEALIEFED